MPCGYVTMKIRQIIRYLLVSLDICQTFSSPGTPAWWIAGKLENHNIKISLTVLSHLFLKYAKTLHVFIHQFFHMEFSNGTLMILLDF